MPGQVGAYSAQEPGNGFVASPGDLFMHISGRLSASDRVPGRGRTARPGDGAFSPRSFRAVTGRCIFDEWRPTSGGGVD